MYYNRPAHLRTIPVSFESPLYTYTHAGNNSVLILLISGMLTSAYCARDVSAQTLMWLDDRVLFLGRSRNLFLYRRVETDYVSH
jgi:hypothetical protein